MPELTHFLSCDWGTSSFRLNLVELPALRVVAEAKSDQGNAATFERWQQAQQLEEQRPQFYQAIIQEHVQQLEQQFGQPLTDVPVVVSGMASSTIGMLELPYKDFPFAADGSDLTTKLLPPTKDFPHPLLLISGAKTADDVIRGEEVQLVGCGFEVSAQAQLFLHPGTHTKHVLVQHGQAVSLTTYMTGELFSLLSTDSILAASVEKAEDVRHPAHARAFEQGVRTSQSGSLLHHAFLVRTNQLFEKLSKAENFFFLSGLLIGYELSTFPADFDGPVVLAGEDVLVHSYEAALGLLGISERIASVTRRGAAEVTLRGQAAILERARKAGQLTPSNPN